MPHSTLWVLLVRSPMLVDSHLHAGLQVSRSYFINKVVISATLVVLRIEGSPVVCKTDEVGEICMNSSAVGSAYWGLPGLTNTSFKVRPLPEEGSTTPWESEFVRTGLLGFLGPVRHFIFIF